MKLPRSPVSPNHPAAQELEALDASPREASRERPRAHPVREARCRLPAVVARSLSGLPRAGGLARGNRNRRASICFLRRLLQPRRPDPVSPRPPASIPVRPAPRRCQQASPQPCQDLLLLGRVPKPLRSVRICSITLVRLLHGLGLLPSGISGKMTHFPGYHY